MNVKILVAVVAFVLGGVIVYNKVLKKSDNEAGFAGGKPGGAPSAMPVAGIIAKPRSISETLQASGTLLANEEVDLKPETSGRVVLLNIREGERVVKGTLLLKINDAELQAQLRKLKLQLDVAQRSEERLKKLLAINGVGQQDYDVALNQLNNIISDIQLTEAQIEKTEIRAPFNGRVGLRTISPGAFATQGVSVASFVDADKLKVDFFVPEKYAAFIRQGELVELEVDGVKEKVLAKVAAVEPRAELASRSIKARAFVENGRQQLLPGLFAKVNLNIGTDNAIMLPSNIIIPEARGKKVMRFAGGKVQPVMIETGLRTKDEVQVLGGLNPGDTIIASSIMFLKPEMDVTLMRVN